MDDTRLGGMVYLESQGSYSKGSLWAEEVADRNLLMFRRRRCPHARVLTGH